MTKTKINRTHIKTIQHPIKVVQFGDGNFIRGFADYIIEQLNSKTNFNGSVAIVKARNGGSMDSLKAQDGLFTLFTKGISDGETINEKQLITCIQKLINPSEEYQEFLNLAHEPELSLVFSNTTEAGIYFDTADDQLNKHIHNSYPAKLTALLYERFVYFKADPTKGLAILPLELIEDNAKILQEIILKYIRLWKLDTAFETWIIDHNYFYNTLVDRIVPGYPTSDLNTYTDQLDYLDNHLIVTEPFLFWAIEAGKELLPIFPVHEFENEIILTKDIQLYRTRKVRILNGAHTLLTPISLLSGIHTVGEAISDPFIRTFVIDSLTKEINPTLSLPKDEIDVFCSQVLDRFKNPFVQHQLQSIALNSISKFKVRLLPIVLESIKNKQELPQNIVFGFGCLFLLYKGEFNNKHFAIQDSPETVNYFKEAWSFETTSETVTHLLQNSIFWGTDLSQYTDLSTALVHAIDVVINFGIQRGYNTYLQTS